jgi:polyisoprenoid-binding protein YceI
MRKLTVALALVGSLAAGTAFAADWNIDPAHSTAGFTVKHMMVTNVRGEFGKVEGKVHSDDKDITKSTIDVTIDASTVDTRMAKRDEHLKSPDFFDVAKFPTITFKSTKIQKTGKDKLKITGDLTMHGVTKPVDLAVEMGDKEWKESMMGSPNVHRGATATAKVNRKDFGLKWNAALEGGGVVVGDEVTIQVDVELVHPAEAAPAKG